jgi:hypothetical protein
MLMEGHARSRWLQLERLGDCIALAAALAGTAIARSAVAPEDRTAWALAIPTLCALAPRSRSSQA